MAVQPIGAAGSAAVGAESSSGGHRFVEQLTDMLREVNRDQIEASKAIEQLTVHGQGSIHEAMIAMSTAEGSFALLMEMRNRLVQAVEMLLQTQV